MKKALFTIGFLTVTILGQCFVEDPGPSCISSPSENNGICVNKTWGGKTSYYCIDKAWYQTANCLQ